MNTELISWPARKSALSQHEGLSARVRAKWPSMEIVSVEVFADRRRQLPHVVRVRASSFQDVWTFPEKIWAVHFAYGLAGWK